MRCLEHHTPTHRYGSGDTPSHTLNSDHCLEVEMLPPEALKDYPGNARTHSKKQIRQIARSIERFGFCNPVLIDDDKQIIAGHGRVTAAMLLGLAAVPTVRLSHLSEAERRAYVVADNRLAEKAGWDREILAIELQALIDLDFEVELTGFETAEIDLCLEEAKEAAGEACGPEDVAPAYTDMQAVSRPGDLWVLGPHLLLCGDARSTEAYGQLLGDSKATFVFTDPPYNVPIDGHVCGLGRIRHRSLRIPTKSPRHSEMMSPGVPT
jgi:ParB-like nuclease domain